MIVYVTSAGKGRNYHYPRPEGRFTVCGRSLLTMLAISRPDAARECDSCAGSFDRVKPPMVPRDPNER